MKTEPDFPVEIHLNQPDKIMSIECEDPRTREIDIAHPTGEQIQEIKDAPIDYEKRMLEAEIALLKEQLKGAQLAAKLAEMAGKITFPPAEQPEVYLGRPMPGPEDIPPGLPLMPEIDLMAGDKTPAVVEWFRDYWPEEYERRYKGRKTHLNRKPHLVDDEDREDAKAPTFRPASDPSLDLSPRAY